MGYGSHWLQQWERVTNALLLSKPVLSSGPDQSYGPDGRSPAAGCMDDGGWCFTERLAMCSASSGRVQWSGRAGAG
jgi:hypothetical protein